MNHPTSQAASGLYPSSEHWEAIAQAGLPRVVVDPSPLGPASCQVKLEAGDLLGPSYQLRLATSGGALAAVDVVVGGVGDVLRGDSRSVIAHPVWGELVIEHYSAPEEPYEHRSHWFRTDAGTAWVSLAVRGADAAAASALLASMTATP